MTLAQLYLAALRDRPETLAIVDAQRQFTRQELERAAWQMARALKARGLDRGDTVAILAGNRAVVVVVLLAVQLLGLRHTALHPLASEADHRFVLEDVGAKGLIADTANYAERGAALRTGVQVYVTLEDTTDGPGLVTAAAREDDSPLEVPDDAGAVYKISYSGGTTGRSKGIQHAHRTAVTMIAQMLATYEWPRTPRYLVTTPISHAAGSLIVPVLLRGGTVYLAGKYSPETFLQEVERQKINFAFLVPTQIYTLLDYEDPKGRDHGSLELVLYGASPMAQARLEQALQRFGPVFGQIYGQAEAPMTISYLRQVDHDVRHPGRLRSCGRVMIGNQVKLLDTELNEVDRGAVGEICVRSPLVMEGYLNRPDENEQVFAGDWLHTGDLARMDDDGFLYLVGRSKDMIISGGFNVYPSEVEDCLARHPDVACAAVIGVPHEKWGEQVVAYVVPRAAGGCTAAQIMEYVAREKGPINAPKQVIFVDALPLTAIGKVDKKQLRDPHWGGEKRQIA